MAACAIALLLPPVAVRAAVAPDVPLQAAETDETFVFDIPAQPLRTALRLYSESTGQAVLFDDSLTLDRRSTGLSGRYGSAEALGLLLQGTGLAAKYASDHSFTLKLAAASGAQPAEAAAAADDFAGRETAALLERYAGKIQRPIQAALCQSPVTRPGGYRLALQIWVGPSGRVQDIKLLSAPVDAGSQETHVRDAFARLTLEPPPKRLPQPITLLLTHAGTGHASPCGDAPRSTG